MLKVALLFLFAACSVGEVPLGGGNPDAPGGGNQANQMSFMTVIQPLVTECTACHTGTPPNLTSFDALQDKYKMKPGSENVLVKKAAAGADHYGVPYFSDAEKATVTGWIDGLQ